MVVNVEQLQAQVDFLEGKVKQLTDLLSLLGVNGLNDAFDGSGNQQFGGGKLRLDGLGIQINASASITGIAFVPSFRASQAALSAGDGSMFTAAANGTQLEILTQQASPSGAAKLNFAITANDTTASIEAQSPVSPFMYPKIELFSSATQSYFGIFNAGSGSAIQFLLDGDTADPTTTLYDGSLWYRSDTDKFRARVNGITRNLTMDGTNTTLTIATGAVTSTTSFHAIDTEAAAATDDLDTISGGETGQVLYIHAANSARDVVAKDGTGNLKLAGDFTLNNVEDTLTLIFDGTNWLELCRSDNGA